MINEEEFKGWLTHPVTKELRIMMARKRAKLRDQWEGGSFTTGDYVADAMKNVNAIGKCEAYTEVQELEYDDFITDVEEADGK